MPCAVCSALRGHFALYADTGRTEGVEALELRGAVPTPALEAMDVGAAVDGWTAEAAAESHRLDLPMYRDTIV